MSQSLTPLPADEQNSMDFLIKMVLSKSTRQDCRPPVSVQVGYSFSGQAEMLRQDAPEDNVKAVARSYRRPF